MLTKKDYKINNKFTGFEKDITWSADNIVKIILLTNDNNFEKLNEYANNFITDKVNWEKKIISSLQNELTQSVEKPISIKDIDTILFQNDEVFEIYFYSNESTLNNNTLCLIGNINDKILLSN